MRHNKLFGWDSFLGIVEKVERLSPWLSRQLTKHASEWPFWYSGLVIDEWQDRHVRVRMPVSRRNALDGEISIGHLVLGGELALRLLLLRYREEFPFRYSLRSTQAQVHFAAAQDVSYRFAIELDEWEKLRIALAREGSVTSEFVVGAFLADGRAAATFTFGVGFTLEKYLPA